MTLPSLIESIDPGHFDRRRVVLENLRETAKAMGFFPLPLSWNDIECFWITLEPNDANKGKKVSCQRDDIEYQPYVEALKQVAKYNEM